MRSDRPTRFACTLHWRRCSVFFVAVAMGVQAAAQTPEVVVTLEREQAFLGESVRYTVLLNHFPNDAMPQLAESADFDFIQIEKRIANEFRSTTVNGRTRSFSRQGPQIVYELTPKRGGDLTIPGPTAVDGSRTLEGQTVKLRVIEPQAQDLARLEVTVDPPEVYPTQTFRVGLRLFVHGLPDPVQDRDPITVQDSMPTLTIPWAREDDALPSGVTAVEPRDKWLQRWMRVGRRQPGGVSINDFQQRGSSLLDGFFGNDPFDVFGSARRRDSRMAFHPTPRREDGKDLDGTRVEYWTYDFDRQFLAEEPGVHDLGTAKLKGLFAKRLRGRRQLDGEAVYTLADPTRVVVLSPPEEGRPVEYIGAIGHFECGADISPTTAKVGDPLTLSVWIRGRGRLANSEAPDLQGLPEFAERFKIYDATEDFQGDTQTFTYGLRPKQEGALEIPVIAMAYFDADREEYVTLRTKSIPIQIDAAEKLRGDQIAIASVSRRETPENIEASAGGIYANVTDLGLLRDQTVHPDRWFLGLGSMAGAFLVLVLARQQLDRRHGDPQAQRRRRIAGETRQVIAEVRSRTSELDSATIADQLSQVIPRLVADTAGTSESSLTASEVVARLEEWDVSPELVQQCRSVLDECDAIRYGSDVSKAAGLVDQVGTTAESLIAALRKMKRLP